jgi:triacylglycerol lipase
VSRGCGLPERVRVPGAGEVEGARAGGPTIRSLGSKALTVLALVLGPATTGTSSSAAGPIGLGVANGDFAGRLTGRTGQSEETLASLRPTRHGASGEVPVILVPGWFDSARELAAMRIHLLGAGWPIDRVATVTFREATGSNRDHAEELDAAIQALIEASGSDRVDVVAHSMGGLATRWYLLTRGAARVRRVVFLGSPHRGTLSAHLAWGGGRDEMMPHSAFLDSLNAAQAAPVGVEAITVRTLIDTHIVPGTSATLPGVPDYPLCCPTHAGLLRDADVFDIVRSFLESGEVARDADLPARR